MWHCLHRPFTSKPLFAGSSIRWIAVSATLDKAPLKIMKALWKRSWDHGLWTRSVCHRQLSTLWQSAEYTDFCLPVVRMRMCCQSKFFNSDPTGRGQLNRSLPCMSLLWGYSRDVTVADADTPWVNCLVMNTLVSAKWYFQNASYAHTFSWGWRAQLFCSHKLIYKHCQYRLFTLHQSSPSFACCFWTTQLIFKPLATKAPAWPHPRLEANPQQSKILSSIFSNPKP